MIEGRPDHYRILILSSIPATKSEGIFSTIESSSYQTELVLTSLSDVSGPSVTLYYTASALASPGVSTKVAIPPHGELRLSNVVATLRAADPAGVGPPGPTYAGVLQVQSDSYPILVFARVLGTTRRFGVSVGPIMDSYFPSPTPVSVTIPNLRQDEGSRSNLVVVNKSYGRFKVEIYDSSGASVAQRELALGPSGYLQINSILWAWAPGTTRGWARVTLLDVAPNGFVPFWAYAIINDGPSPGLGTGDGSVVWMEPEP